MKTFTDIPIAQNQAVKPETVNNNFEKYLNEWNGNLNGNNMPVFSVQDDNVQGAKPAFTSIANVTKFFADLQTQGYYKVRRSSSFEGNTDVWTPILTLDLKTDDWSKGWNRLQYYSGFEDFSLNFSSTEGMLVGCAIIDWQHGTDALLVNLDEINFSSARGHDWTSEWGVFVNDVLVGRTGVISPQRHTTEIPFSIPCGSQNIKIDVRWISVISDYNTLGQPHGSEFVVYSAEIWCRNVYR